MAINVSQFDDSLVGSLSAALKVKNVRFKVRVKALGAQRASKHKTVALRNDFATEERRRIK